MGDSFMGDLINGSRIGSDTMFRICVKLRKEKRERVQDLDQMKSEMISLLLLIIHLEYKYMHIYSCTAVLVT